MFHSFESRTQVHSMNRTALVSCVVAVFALLCATELSAQVVATYSFEDGTADGWTSFFGASTPVATNAAAYSGSYSLLTTTSSTWHRRTLHFAEQRAIARGEVYDHRLCRAYPRRKRLQRELHHHSAAIPVARAVPATTRLAVTRCPSRPLDGCRSAALTPSARRRLGCSFTRSWWEPPTRNPSIWTRWSSPRLRRLPAARRLRATPLRMAAWTAGRLSGLQP